MAEKSGIIQFEKLIEAGLELEDKIGRSKSTVAQAYRGLGNSTPPTEEQVRILRDEYGISLERQERENGTQIFIDKLKILKKYKIDTSKITSRDTIKTLAEKSGFTDFEKLKRQGLKLEEKIGQSKTSITQAYRGQGERTPPTEEQVRILMDEYGISLERQERENGIQIFIDKLKILKKYKIDTSKIAKSDTIKTLAEKSGFIDFEKLEGEGLKLEDKIGQSRSSIAQAYRGKAERTPPTEEQVRILRDEYGISLERKKIKTQDIAKTTYDALAPQCEEASQIIESLIEEQQQQVDSKNDINPDVQE